MECTIKIEISDDQIKGLLCSAFEGGTYYWCRIKGYDFTEKLSLKDFKKGGRYHSKWFHHSQVIPLVPNCNVKIKDILDKGRTYTLDLESIKRGFKVMTEKYPKYFGDFINDNYDTETGDIFLQCCLFGEIKHK